ncbi:UNVERIFIED_CONTAM: hypothetical protein PYX00_004354 [Menopon gallinae]|uniref:Uncharacterized protein n=1 Tax=Menopon gallinae TaxID=328185 RepID=A0AAW2I4P2_9NEOP
MNGRMEAKAIGEGADAPGYDGLERVRRESEERATLASADRRRWLQRTVSPPGVAHPPDPKCSGSRGCIAPDNRSVCVHKSVGWRSRSFTSLRILVYQSCSDNVAHKLCSPRALPEPCPRLHRNRRLGCLAQIDCLCRMEEGRN